MPRVLADPAQAADVAAFLVSLGGGAAQPTPAGGDVSRGGLLYSTLMCAACHAAPDAATLAENDTRIPLGHVKAKFRPPALRQYLLKPEAHYAWNPMPNFRLSDDEAADLAAFLLAKANKTVDHPAAPGDAAKGKLLVESAGCLNCHTIENQATTLKAPAFAAIDGSHWTQGCMAADAAARKTAPDFGLADPQRHALLALAATDRASLARETPMELSLRQVAAMRCLACHARDGNESNVSTEYAADAGALAAAYPPPPPSGGNAEGEFFAPDQRPPMLTWAGEKLRPEWSAAFIAGQISYKPRPYLRARMPAFPARAKLIAEGLAAEQGYPPATPAYPKPDEQAAAAGRKLIGAAGGFSCVQCHAVGAAPPLAPFEAPALNMRYISERLRKDYYDRWMLNPIKVDPNTKMPAFADAEGKSAIRDVYDGDAIKQFEAVWHFLLRGKDVTPPQ
jgi:mono/diheme cytochrome c family protein